MITNIQQIKINNKRMKISNIILGAFITIITFTSCKEDEIDLYSGIASMNIGIVNTADENEIDTVASQAFGFINDQFKDYKIKFYLSGLPVSVNRKFNVEFSGNSVKDIDFDMDNNFTLKAGEIEMFVPCKIIRSAGLADEDKTLSIVIRETDDLGVSVMNRAVFTYTDGVPTSWINVQYNFGDTYLGECSKVKYMFLYDVTEIYDFEPYTYTFVQSVGKLMTSKLLEYNDDPGAFEIKYNIPAGKFGPAPMKDENGNTVVFL